MGFVEFLFETKKGKMVMGFIYGWGGAIVIIGALFKIMHWPGASFFLVLGLLVEAGIFIISAFEPPHSEVDWSLVYPELAGMHDEDLHIEHFDHAEEEKEELPSDAISQTMDMILKEANIGPELLESLGKGMKKLSESTKNLNSVGDIATANNDFVDNIQHASTKVEELAGSYERASQSLTGLSVSPEQGQNYANQLTSITQNLKELNDVYASQLNSAKQQISASNEMYQGLGDLMASLNSTVEDTRKYKENIQELSSNLSQLNTIYGNMLTAMNAGFGRGNK